MILLAPNSLFIHLNTAKILEHKPGYNKNIKKPHALIPRFLARVRSDGCIVRLAKSAPRAQPNVKSGNKHMCAMKPL